MAAGGRSNHSTCQGAYACASGGAPLRVIHAGAASGQNDNGCDTDKNMFAHVFAPRDVDDTGLDAGCGLNREPTLVMTYAIRIGVDWTRLT